MKKQPANLRPMDEAPRDGTPIDIWSDSAGWVRVVWFDADYGPDGWVTICPRPFVGWRHSRYAWMLT